jgi:CMP-N-acetylneuraminic acid synthetase
MKTVAFVPIRLNSKRVLGKNLKNLNGRPLLEYVFKTLLKVEGIDEIYAFCSQESIKDFLPSGIRFLKRDESLDQDTTLGIEIYDSFYKQISADVYILAHTTSPFLKPETIKDGLSRVMSGNYDSAFTVEKRQTFTWFKGIPLNYSLAHIPRTQDLTPVYLETSAFFIYTREVWGMNKQRIGARPYLCEVDKIEGIDIDYPEDFAFAELIAKILIGNSHEF